MRLLSRAVFWFVAGTLATSANLASSKDLAPDAPTLTVVVRDEVWVPRHEAAELRTVATGILKRVQVRTQWVWCGPRHLDRQPALCAAGPARGRVVLYVVHSSLKMNAGGRLPLGRAEIGTGRAFLHFQQVQYVALRNDLSLGNLLAHVAAHEIGHLYMGGAHARYGLMRARWSKPDYRSMTREEFSFLPAEAEVFRVALSRLALRRDTGTFAVHPLAEHSEVSQSH